MNTFNLGATLRDRITGFEGVAVGRHSFYSGTVQYQLIPKTLTDKGVPGDAILLDWQHLELVTETPEPQSPLIDTPFKIGDTVEDTITDFAGVITVRSEFVNGCVQFGVQPKTLEKGDIVRPRSLDSQRLRLRVAGAPAESRSIGGPEMMPAS